MDPRSLTLDNQTRASSPGGLPVQYPLFLRCFPRFPLVCLAVAVVSLALTPWQPSFAILAVVVLAVFALWMVRLREHFQHGCVNPAKVISHRPGMIAVITDLTTGKGKAPVIKILSHPLSRMAGGRPTVGTRLATIGLYSGNGQKGQWDDFFPVAANCASTDDNAIRTMLRGIPPVDWVELEEGLRQVNGKAPGLYKIDLAALEREEWAI